MKIILSIGEFQQSLTIFSNLNSRKKYWYGHSNLNSRKTISMGIPILIQEKKIMCAFQS